DLQLDTHFVSLLEKYPTFERCVVHPDGSDDLVDEDKPKNVGHNNVLSVRQVNESEGDENLKILRGIKRGYDEVSVDEGTDDGVQQKKKREVVVIDLVDEDENPEMLITRTNNKNPIAVTSTIRHVTSSVSVREGSDA
ncbi:hypothetical protein HK102_009605, partial [Quaeritorhiza haematococci]